MLIPSYGNKYKILKLLLKWHFETIKGSFYIFVKFLGNEL